MNKKRFSRLLLTLLSVILLLSVGLITASAEDMYTSNVEYAKAANQALELVKDDYRAKAGTAPEMAQKVILIINSYSSIIQNIPEKEPDHSIDLSSAIDAEREKAVQVAKLAWIAYAHSEQSLPDYSDTAAVENNVLKQLKDYKDKIDATKTVEEAQSNIDTYCKEMLQFVFEDNLTILLRAGEQGYGITDEVYKYIDEIKELTSSDIDATPYIEIYDKALHFVTVRRAYAAAETELSECIALLGDHAESQPVKDFAAALKTVNSIDDVNNALNSAVCGIIALRIEKDTGYIGSFKKSLISACESATALACDKELDENGNAVIADLSACLVGIDLKEYRADTKDKTAALITETAPHSTLTGIVNEYTKDGGILDGCNDTESLDFEYERAKLRVDWYRAYTEHKKAIDSDLLPISGTTIAKDAEELYSTTDNAIRSVEPASDGATYEELIDECEAILSDALEDIDDLAAQAKAKRFVHDKSAILGKELSQIALGDEGLLNDAISAYTALDDDVKGYLTEEKKDINDKYKALSVIKTDAAADGEDGQALIDATNALSSELAPDALKALADDNVRRAEALGTLQEKYAEITGADNFDSYDEASRNALEKDHSDASAEILASERSEGETAEEFSAELDGINAAAALAMEKHAAIAEVRLAAKDCELDDVKKTVADAEAAINADTNAEDIYEEREAAKFRIECQKKAAQKRDAIAELKEKIASLPALSETAKAALTAEADALYSDCEDIASAADEVSLDEAVETLDEKLSSLSEKADGNALAEGKRQAIEAIETARDKAKSEIDGYAYIDYVTDGTSATLKTELDGIAEELAQKAGLDTTGWNELEALKEAALADIAEVSAEAKAAELSGAKQSALDALDTAFAHPEHYSETNRAAVQKIVDDCSDDIEKAQTVDEIHTLRDTALEEIKGVPTLLDEAKSTSLASVEEVYALLEKDKHCYSEQTWAEIDEIYSHTLAEIKLLSDFSDRERAVALANERTELMRAKRRDTVYTADGILASGGAYPDGYDHIRNGYSASVSAAGQIPHDASLSVFPFTDTEIEEMIRRAVKSKSVYMLDGTQADKAVLKKLRGCNVITGLDIEYSYADTAINGMYTVRVLLPAGLDTDGLLGVAYVRADGSVEYFEATVTNGVAEFDIPHFSSFYLISEKTVNLLPLIIILAIILAAEAVVIALLLLRRVRATKDTKMASVMPFMPIIALARILPKGGIAISVILGVLALLAGGAIAYLVLTEKRQEAEKHTVAEEPVCENEPIPQPAPVIEEPAPVLVLQAVTVDEANELMSDSDAQAAIEEAPTETVSAVYSTHGKKHEVNIDTISAVFEPDETVSLVALKEKGLVPKSAKAVKILARGTLDKPLTVIAQDFSTAAVKMITLTGGHAMIVERE